MTFAEKLVFLMKLTATSNKQLADAAKVDPSLISLWRTARRNMPKNTSHTRAIAVYLAKKCSGNYQRMALSEALGRKNLKVQMGTDQLSSILFDWLTDNRDEVGQFLSTFERFSLKEPDNLSKEAVDSPPMENDSCTYAYYGNEGKRGAIDAFISFLMSLEKPGTILISLDESLEWLFEDPIYHARLQKRMVFLLQKGFHICRVANPFSTVEQAFDSLSRWLPLYMTGQVEALYYPRLRDDLYHRTLIVLPEAAAVVASSIGNQPMSRATILTMDQRLTNAYAGEFQDLLSKCRPMMTTYSTAGNPGELLRCISQFESDRGNRIQQSTGLSSITSPPELFHLAAQNAATKEDTVEILNTLLRAQSLFQKSLEEYEVIDIHSLATADEVRAGIVPVCAGYLGQEILFYYTPETYIQHLQSIIAHMEKYKNYRAVVLPRCENTHALMVKDGRQALLLRPKAPLTIFEVSQPYIAEACREYLMRLIKASVSAERQRQDTLIKLKEVAEDLRCG